MTRSLEAALADLPDKDQTINIDDDSEMDALIDAIDEAAERHNVSWPALAREFLGWDFD